MAWKDFGRPLKQGSGAKRRKNPVVLVTGSFYANVGVWVCNDEKRRRLQSHDDNPQAEDVNEEPVETNMNDPEEDDNEEWHFSTLLTGPDSEIKSIEFSPPHYPANFLATSSRDKTVWIWEEVEPEEWETIAVLSEHTGDVKCVGWCSGAQRRRPKRRKVGKMDGDVDMGGANATGEGQLEANGNLTAESVLQHNGEEDEEDIIGARPILASGSYDDTIRLWRDVEEEGDWICVAVIASHTGTVWDIKWEGHINYSLPKVPDNATTEEESTAIREFETDWQPRILSCSDDLSVRTWRRQLSTAEREKRRLVRHGDSTGATARMGFASSRIPSVLRPMSAMETWVEDATLPQVHVRSVYAVDWSKRTGLVVSCGGDGTIAVYREVPITASSGTGVTATGEERDVVMNGTTSSTTEDGPTETDLYTLNRSTWEVIALIESAHDEYEINHVCWAERRDKGRRFEGEEIIASTGDEGDVRIWTLPEEILQDVES